MNAQIKVYAGPHDSLCDLTYCCYVDYEVLRNVATYRIGEQPIIRWAVLSKPSLLSNIEYGTMDLCC